MPTPPVPPPRRPAPDPKLDLSKYTDLHITVGLLDERVRVTLDDFRVLQVHNLVGGEDVFLLVQRGESEANLMLRGKESIRVFRTKSNPDAKLPLARVFTLEAIQRRLLEQEAAKAASPRT